MDITYLAQGIVIGFSIAAPVGPIGILCIQRSLTDGQRVGLISGLGAATADAVYGLIAGLGLAVVTNLLMGGQMWLRLIGGAFLLYLGVRTLVTTPAAQSAAVIHQGRGLINAYLSTFILTLTNPLTILSFAAIFAGLGAVENTRGRGDTFYLVAGVFSGSALWWLTLSTLAAWLGRRFAAQNLRWLNWLSGTVLIAFGVVALAGLLG